MRRSRQFVLLILCGVLCGCMGRAYRPGAPIAQPTRHFIGRDYPQAFEAVQRVEVKIGRREFQFTGYLQVDRERGFYGVALGEMGIKLFEFRRDGDTIEIIHKPKGMPLNPMLGVVDDLWLLYGKGRNPQWIQREDGQGLIEQIGSDTLAECQFQDGRLARSIRVQGNRVISEATCGAIRPIDGCAAPLPESIRLHNTRWRYTMTIRHLSIKPLPAAQATLGRSAP